MELVTNHITFCVCCLLNLPRCHNQHTCLLNWRNSWTTANRRYNRRKFSSGAERRKFPIKKCLDTFISHLVDWTLRFPYATLQNKKKNFLFLSNYYSCTHGLVKNNHFCVLLKLLWHLRKMEKNVFFLVVVVVVTPFIFIHLVPTSPLDFLSIQLSSYTISIACLTLPCTYLLRQSRYKMESK